MKKYKIKIIASCFNQEITDLLISGAKKSANSSEITSYSYVPGAFEIPAMVNQVLRNNKESDNYDGIITLGSIIKGETAHFEYISSSVINTLSQISLNSDIPVALGILTCYDYEQAILRAKSKKQGGLDKGGEVMTALLQTIEAWNSLTK